ncbi:MAG: protease, partial [Steroidobacteraceae bacterium]
HYDPQRQFEAVWSPDSRWIAYSRQLDNQLRAIFLYSLTERRTHQLTDGMADAVTPAFDASGRYLYFFASTDYALNVGWLDMSGFERPLTRSVYLVVLAADEPSPLLARADDAPAAAAAQAREGAERSNATRVDIEGIRQRIVALNIAPANYANLTAGTAGTIFYTASTTPAEPGANSAPRRLYQYQLATDESRPFLEGIGSYTLSGDKRALLYQGAGGDPSSTPWGVVPTEQPAQIGQGALNAAQLAARVDPRAEWANIFRETWRIQRDFFYDSKMHGADWQAIYEKYQPLVAHVRHRADLTYLQAQLGGELSVGHSFALGGEGVDEEPVGVGLLGADFT